MSDDQILASKLPSRCFAQLPSTGETVAIIRGEMGYHPVVTVQTVEQLNATLPQRPTPDQVEAMLAGSMFGWHVPAALAHDGSVAGSLSGKVAMEAGASSQGPAVADWGGPYTPFQLAGCGPLHPGLSRQLDRLWAYSDGHLGFYGWLRVANRRTDRVFLCGLLDLPARNWRDEYDGRVPPAEAADVAIDEYASQHGTGLVPASAWTPPGT